MAHQPINDPNLGQWLILVTEQDRAVGRATKLDAHRQGLLHRAFSLFVFRPDGRLLIQKRAAHKYHAGGLWANSCCGHPRDGHELMPEARRRLREELGMACPLRWIGTTRYRADCGNGMTENEYVHFLVGVTEALPTANPDEVEDFAWVGRGELERLMAEKAVITPWFEHYVRNCWDLLFANTLAA